MSLLTDTFFVLSSLDTLAIPHGLPDGKWKIFWDGDSLRTHYVFYLRNNNVTGFFQEYDYRGNWCARGTYKDDSLWTFRSNSWGSGDSTFKVALWEYQALGFIKEDFHKIPFEKLDSIYVDTWYYENGKQLCKRVYHKKNGLICEEWFYENSDKASFFEKKKSYSIEIEWDRDQKISKLTLDQGQSYQLQLDSVATLYSFCDNCIVQTSFDSHGNMISSVIMDKSGKLKYFKDGDLILSYDSNGIAETLQYWTRKRSRYKVKDLK